MIEDIYYFKKEHFDLADKIYDNLIYQKDYKIIGIGGIPGSAKSETATILSQKLNDIGIWARVLSLDSYYLISAEKREENRRATGVIGSKEINWKSVRQFIYEHHHFDSIIIEGLYALDYTVDYGIYIDRTLKDTYTFRKEREKEDPDSTWRHHVLRKECMAVLKTKEKAGLVI